MEISFVNLSFLILSYICTFALHYLHITSYFLYSVFQPTTASVSTRGSRRPRRHVLCASSASLTKTRSTQSPSPRTSLGDVGRKKALGGKRTRSALLCCGPPTRAPRLETQDSTQPPPPPPPLLPSAWHPPHATTQPSWATMTSCMLRRTQTQKVRTRERKGTTLMMTQHSLLVRAKSGFLIASITL